MHELKYTNDFYIIIIIFKTEIPVFIFLCMYESILGLCLYLALKKNNKTSIHALSDQTSCLTYRKTPFKCTTIKTRILMKNVWRDCINIWPTHMWLSGICDLFYNVLVLVTDANSLLDVQSARLSYSDGLTLMDSMWTSDTILLDI